MGYDAGSLVAAIRALGAVIAQRRTELTQLDQEIGDGDHGENLARGFSAVLTKLRAAEPETPAKVLSLVATTLISTVGGASGPLFGTAFLRASTVFGAASQLDGNLVAAALAAARDGVVARGKAELGDKTMVDALSPAVDAAMEAAAKGADVVGVTAAAAEAAAKGAESTKPMQARKGRASYLGERSIGHVDPGAMSTAYLLASLAASAASHTED
jgi:phosphoenolpyruvate---glycerone phosphotransferase subunit DhaL